MGGGGTPAAASPVANDRAGCAESATASVMAMAVAAAATAAELVGLISPSVAAFPAASLVLPSRTATSVLEVVAVAEVDVEGGGAIASSETAIPAALAAMMPAVPVGDATEVVVAGEAGVVAREVVTAVVVVGVGGASAALEVATRSLAVAVGACWWAGGPTGRRRRWRTGPSRLPTSGSRRPISVRAPSARPRPPGVAVVAAAVPPRLGAGRAAAGASVRAAGGTRKLGGHDPMRRSRLVTGARPARAAARVDGRSAARVPAVEVAATESGPAVASARRAAMRASRRRRWATRRASS